MPLERGPLRSVGRPPVLMRQQANKRPFLGKRNVSWVWFFGATLILRATNIIPNVAVGGRSVLILAHEKALGLSYAGRGRRAAWHLQAAWAELE